MFPIKIKGKSNIVTNNETIEIGEMIKNHAEEVSINIYYHVIVGYGKKLLNFIPKEIKRDVKSSALGNT